MVSVIPVSTIDIESAACLSRCHCGYKINVGKVFHRSFSYGSVVTRVTMCC